jgi:hypothetical protein
LLESESIREKETKKNTQTMKMIQNIQGNWQMKFRSSSR